MRDNRALLLDLFRIILCLGVVVYHYTPERPSSGPLMVNGFLVMSGFLIGCSFLRNNVFDVSKFYAGKTRRLLPMLFVVVVMSLACYGLGKGYIVNGLYGKMTLVDFAMVYNVPLWYIVVECALLLAVPMFYWLYKSGKLVFMCILMACYTWFMFNGVPEKSMFAEGLYFSPLARCWQFVLGIVSATVFLKTPSVWLKKSIENRFSTWGLFAFFCIIAGIFMVIKQSTDLTLWNYTFCFDLLTSLLFAVLIPKLYLYRADCGKRISSATSYLAKLTYPMFLVHVLVYKVFLNLTERYVGHGYNCFIVTLSVVGSIILAAFLLAADSWWSRRGQC